MFIFKSLSSSVLVVLACVGGAAWAAEYNPADAYVVLIRACGADNRCSEYRQPFDADNEVACQTTSSAAATRWSLEHPSLKLKSFRCARAIEHAS